MKALVVPLLAGVGTVLQAGRSAQLDPAWAVVLPADSWRRYMSIPCSRDGTASGGEVLGARLRDDWATEIALVPARCSGRFDEKLKGPGGARPASSDY